MLQRKFLPQMSAPCFGSALEAALPAAVFKQCADEGESNRWLLTFVACSPIDGKKCA